MKVPIVYVIAGTVVLMALARYQPHTAGWLVLALTLLLLVSASQKGVLQT